MPERSLVQSEYGLWGVPTRNLFGVDFESLEVEHVSAFLDDAGEEGLLWEAKGGGVEPNRGSVRKAVCAFANSSGGFLIVGADREAATMRWSLNGVPFTREDEPSAWFDKVIRDGVAPVPDHRVGRR